MWTKLARVMKEGDRERSHQVARLSTLFGPFAENIPRVSLRYLLYHNDDSYITVRAGRYNLTGVLGELTKLRLACLNIGFGRQFASVDGGICFRI